MSTPPPDAWAQPLPVQRKTPNPPPTGSVPVTQTDPLAPTPMSLADPGRCWKPEGDGAGGGPLGPSKASTVLTAGASNRPSATVGVGKWLASEPREKVCSA